MIVRVPPEEWDISNSGELVNLLKKPRDSPTAIVDLSDVRFMDSACLAKLGVLQKERVERGLPPAAFVVTTASLRRLFTVLSFDTRWKVFETLPSAVAATERKVP